MRNKLHKFMKERNQPNATFVTTYLQLLCKKHITGVHEGRKPFMCEHATFGSKKTIWNQLSLITYKNSFECKFC